MKLHYDIFLKVVYNRIFSKCYLLLSNTQFGFISGLNTRDTLLDIKWWYKDVGLWIENRLSVPLAILRPSIKYLRGHRLLIYINFFKQYENIKVDWKLSSCIEIKRGVSQGCIMSPLLFNLYAETFFQKHY